MRLRSAGAPSKWKARFGALVLGVSALFGACNPDSRELKPADDESEGGASAAATGGGAGKGNHAGTMAGGEPGRAGSGGEDSECGDGLRDEGEACDDGNNESGDGCSATCRIEPSEATCGDGKVEEAEACDDGNQQPGDGCDERCRSESCGNGRKDVGEECDPPSAGACTDQCLLLSEHCGDGKVQADEHEQCDDGNEDSSDGCGNCRKQCGDGRIDQTIGEECDPTYSPDRCSGDCQWLPFCNDGVLQPEAAEECDPSNGSTCVACRSVEPPPPCGDGGEAGCGGAPSECVPAPSGPNLIQNGTFQTDVEGWLPHSTLVSVNRVEDGGAGPGALEVKFASGPVRAVSGAYQCVPVQPGQSYTLRAQYRIPAGAPSGVAASMTALLYAGSHCSGTFVSPPHSGPQGAVRDTWTPYEFTLSAGGLPAGTTDARLLVRLDVVRPGALDGSRVLWDNVALASGGGACGNCAIGAGETCDDGNQVSGDGCSPSCQLETCGDGVLSPPEQCDDGNTEFAAGDACTPACRTPSPCDVCTSASCAEPVQACLGLEGVASDGPRAGTARSTLCDVLQACVRRTACDLAQRPTRTLTGAVEQLAFLENCYCGTAGVACFEEGGEPNGSCRAEIEAALETQDRTLLLGRFDGKDAHYPVFAAARTLLKCQDGPCAADCSPRTPACGNGRIEDRDFSSFPYVFEINRKDVPCADELTHTGLGCSVEECDGGDDCDANCFLLACGNNVNQESEECDDGNTVSHDGCSEDCQAEYHCGDEILEPEFEDCDPPTPDGHVCSQTEFASNPESCGCDAKCHRIVCADGVRQAPEQCDPPDGLSCGEDCKLLDQGPCEKCISEHPDLGPVNETYCNSDRLCIDVKQCIIRNPECFFPSALVCFCGEGVDEDACAKADFEPTGPCAAEIRAGTAEGDATNAEVLEYFYYFEYPTGVAVQLFDAAFSNGAGPCASECFPAPPAP